MGNDSQSPDEGFVLLQHLRQKFSEITADYNQIQQLAKQLENSNNQLKDQSVLVEGFRQTIVNRYHGITNIRQLLNPALEGAKWSWYFCMAPNLASDVQYAGNEWLKSKLSAPSFENVAVVVATGIGTTAQDTARIKDAAQKRVKSELQTMGVSLAVSSGISMLLKQVGTTAKSEFTRGMALTTRRGWQTAGLLAIAYGFGKISQAINDSGPFALHLRTRRDDYVDTQMGQIQSTVNALSNLLEEGMNRGWR